MPAECEHPAHLYYLMLPNLEARQGLLRHLGERRIQATFHYQSLHSSPAGVRFGRVGPGGCEQTDLAADRVLRLPLFAGLSDQDLDRVIDGVLEFRP